MAKLKAPLLSLGASGAIGKSLVYFSWKGLDCVREYVVPANPKTAGQNTQRGYLTAAVAAIHAALGLAAQPLDENDRSAYALKGSTYPTPRTWFNQICKFWIDVKVAAKVPVIYRSGGVGDKTADSINLWVYISEETGSQLANGSFYFGTSKTSLIHAKAGDFTPGSMVELADEDCSAFLTAGVKYFWQFRPLSTDPCAGAESGIYYFTAE